MGMDGAVAIVGMGGILPGAADLAAFWQNILAKTDAAGDVPPHRWIVPPHDVLGNDLELDQVYSLRACLVDHIPLDAAGLDLDPGLLAQLDPLYHMVLHAGRAAFLDGVTAGLDRARVGVVLAAIALPTDSASALSREVFARFLEEGVLGSASPGRDPDSSAGHGTAGAAGERVLTHPLNSRV